MKTNFVFTTVNVLFWIVFIGLCIKTGTLLISVGINLFVKEEIGQILYQEKDYLGLMEYGKGYYLSMMSFVVTLSALKAYMAYLVICLFLKLDRSRPFSPLTARQIMDISRVALATGIFTIGGNGYVKWLNKKYMDLPDMDHYLGNGGEMLFLAGIIYVIAVIFDKGVTLQSESELTV